MYKFFTGTETLRKKCKAQYAFKSFSLIFSKRSVDFTAITSDQCVLLMQGFSVLCFRLQMASLQDVSVRKTPKSYYSNDTTTKQQTHIATMTKKAGGYDDGTVSTCIEDNSYRLRDLRLQSNNDTDQAHYPSRMNMGVGFITDVFPNQIGPKRSPQLSVPNSLTFNQTYSPHDHSFHQPKFCTGTYSTDLIQTALCGVHTIFGTEEKDPASPAAGTPHHQEVTNAWGTTPCDEATTVKHTSSQSVTLPQSVFMNHLLLEKMELQSGMILSL
jgi:hypothetical protein